MAYDIQQKELPAPTHLRVGTNPFAVTKGAEGAKDVFPQGSDLLIKGLYRDVHLNAIANAKAQITEKGLTHFLEHDETAHLGDGTRHPEAGTIGPEPYHDIHREGESLAPISAPHMNIISETDRTIERGASRVSHNRDDYAGYFMDYSKFSEFMDMLKGNLMNGIQTSLVIISKTVLTADPTQISIDDKDIARIFGATGDNKILEGKRPNPKGSLLTPEQASIEKYVNMMKGLINKYSSKARNLGKNIYHYNCYHGAFNNMYGEDGRPFFTYGAKDKKGTPVTSDKDGVKVHTQQTYTDAHKIAGEEDDLGGEKVTRRIIDLHRNDCLFALFDAIKKAVNVLTNEKSTEFGVGRDNSTTIAKDPESGAQGQKKMMEAVAQGLVGEEIIPGVQRENLAQNYNENTARTCATGFEVTCDKDNLILFLNPEDYDDLDSGVGRRGPMDVRAINLDMLRKYCSNIYPLRGMRPGFARLIDKRAFKIRSYFQTTHVEQPGEYIHGRYKLFFFFCVSVFSLFGGTLFIPTPHFVASPRFYDQYNILGQKIEEEQEARDSR